MSGSLVSANVSPSQESQRITKSTMPEISRFFGIIIRMFPELGAPHHRPHVHAVHQNMKALCSLSTLSNASAALFHKPNDGSLRRGLKSIATNCDWALLQS